MAHATQLNMHARSNDTPKRARYCPAHARFSRWHARPWHATARLTRSCHGDFPVPPGISSKNPGSEAQKATILSVLDLREYTACPHKNKCALNAYPWKHRAGKENNPSNQGPHSITMLSSFFRKSEHQTFCGVVCRYLGFEGMTEKQDERKKEKRATKLR
jgi:hypothetical protein